jgi:phenylpropionate dioxygenase-like ring-hydroxylating dioxygenase large terminal subunit
LTAFLRNSWYVAAWDREVTRALLARTLLGEPVVLFRKESGEPVALEDRCCHRYLPLSMGKLEGDELRCGYHGLKFDASGKCVEIPGQASIPPQAKVKAFPLIEKYNWVWIWMGEPAKADPALIPNWWWAGHPEWAFTRPDRVHLKCNYQLIADNVLDVTHLAYVHASSIGSASIIEFPATVEREERLVRLTRWIRDRPPPPLYQKAGGFPGNVDRWQIVEHVPPCFSVNFAGCKDRSRKISDGFERADARDVEYHPLFFRLRAQLRLAGRRDGEDLRRRHGAGVQRGLSRAGSAAAHARAQARSAEGRHQGRRRAARRAAHARGDARQGTLRIRGQSPNSSRPFHL